MKLRLLILVLGDTILMGTIIYLSLYYWFVTMYVCTFDKLLRMVVSGGMKFLYPQKIISYIFFGTKLVVVQNP